jgi:multisubunit Na+/H+ antiporter MnhE subunit
MKPSTKKDLFFVFATVFCLLTIILLLASFSYAGDDKGFSFASGFIFGTIISQFLFLFFNRHQAKFKVKKIKRGKDIKYWWNDGKPPDFRES